MRLFRLIVLFSLVLLLNAPTQAQTKYSTWSDPDQSSGGKADTAELIKQLNKLVDEAEKARAADPTFLRDLRDLARSYKNPWDRAVLSDDFFDGNFTTDPTWTVSAGRYWVEQGWGLRSAITVADQNQPQQTKKSDQRDAVIALLGAVLGKSSGGGTATSPTGPEIAAIYSPAAIGNAFAIDMEFSSWIQQGQPSGGHFEFGPYQGNNRTSGYRLSYSPGEGLTLLIVSPRGRRIIDQSVGPMALEDKKPHTLRWTRDGRGRMKINVDNKEILRVTDRGFNDSFQGLVMTNRGGDYIVKKITVSSAN